MLVMCIIYCLAFFFFTYMALVSKLQLSSHFLPTMSFHSCTSCFLLWSDQVPAQVRSMNASLPQVFLPLMIQFSIDHQVFTMPTIYNLPLLFNLTSFSNDCTIASLTPCFPSTSYHHTGVGMLVAPA